MIKTFNQWQQTRTPRRTIAQNYHPEAETIGQTHQKLVQIFNNVRQVFDTIERKGHFQQSNYGPAFNQTVRNFKDNFVKAVDFLGKSKALLFRDR